MKLAHHPDHYISWLDEPHLWAEVRHRAKTSLLFLLKCMYPETWDTFDFDDLHGEMVENLECSDDLHQEVPRDHRKTTLLRAWIQQRILIDPNRRVIYASKTLPLAKDVSGTIRAFFGSEFIKHYFPEFFMQPGKQHGLVESWIVPARTDLTLVSPTFKAYGLGNAIAGQRGDDIVVDDPIDRQSCGTPALISGSMTWITDLYQLMESPKHYTHLGVPQSRKLLTMTPWHYDDVGARVMRTRSYRHYIRHCFEAVGTLCTECPETVEPHWAFDEEDGSALYPKMWDRDELISKREDLEADPDSGIDTFYCQYGVLRRNPKGTVFEADWFTQQKLPHNLRGMRGFVTGDSAWKDTTQPGTGDYSWFWEVAVDRHGVAWVIDSFRTRTMTAKEGADAIVTMLRDLRSRGCSATLVYQKVGEITWPGDVMAECRRARIPYVEAPVTVAGKSKWDRGLRLAGPAERGEIVFSSEIDEKLFKEFVAEITHAPRWPHDDGWDGLANIYDPKVRARVSAYSGHAPANVYSWGTDWNQEVETTQPSRSRYMQGF
jgi:hypothetical protein